MATLPTIYTARSDVRAADLDRVKDWYARRHAPDLIRAGFYTAQVYHADVGPQSICNLYEIPGPELFLTTAYREVAARDTEGPAVIALMENRSNTVYTQVLTVNVPAPRTDWARGDRTGAVDAPVLTTVRLDLDESDEGALLDWYATREFPRLQSRSGFRAGRVCRRGAPHPTAASRDPRWFVFNEWDDLNAALGDGEVLEVTARHEAALRGRMAQLVYNVGRRGFRLVAS